MDNPNNMRNKEVYKAFARHTGISAIIKANENKEIQEVFNKFTKGLINTSELNAKIKQIKRHYNSFTGYLEVKR